MGQTFLTIDVADATEVWPDGLSADQIKQRVLAEVNSSGLDASRIDGIGDGALFTTNPKSHDATAKAYVVKARGILLWLTFHGGYAAAQKGNLAALLKAAATAL